MGQDEHMLWSRLASFVDAVTARPRTRDAIAAVGYLILGIVLLQFGGYGIRGAGLAIPESGLWSAESGFLVLLALMAALALLRSSRPFLALMLAVPVVAADLALGSSIGVVLVFADLVYCAFRYGGDRGVRVLIVVIAAAVAVTTLALILWPGVPTRVVTVALQWMLIVLVGALWGWNVRSERQRTRAGADEEHRRATGRMRQRIAHDLHDLVANQIAVAGLNIEAARLRTRERTTDETLALAVQGTEEAQKQLRRLIAVLSTVDDLADDRASPALGDLDTLVPTGRELVYDGAALEAALASAPHAAGIAMRAIHELVANAVKHGSGDVELRTHDDDGRAVVLIGNAVSVRGSSAGSGIGIPGATLLLDGIGGELVSALVDDGRWQARVTLPKGADA